MQRNPPRSSMHVPSFWHGFDSHSLIFTSHRRPLNPCLQSHLYDPAVLTQIPSCSHGEPSKCNVKSVIETQIRKIYCYIRNKQTLLHKINRKDFLKSVPSSHSLMSSSQLWPVYPVGQRHLYEPLITLVSHIAFGALQGFEAQASSK